VNPPEHCPVCGFTFTGRSIEDAITDLSALAEAWRELLRETGPLGLRPSPERWSALEYAGHVRDVLLSIRERCILAVIREDGIGAPIHREERMDAGLGVCGTPRDVARDLAMATSLLQRTLLEMHGHDDERVIQYSPISPFTTSVQWMANQAAHESGHHLNDARASFAEA